ncbi:MAG: hypothetical protein ACJARD_000794 [Alphaproteobacteria bacterium]|jgi:hypothetical protein
MLEQEFYHALCSPLGPVQPIEGAGYLYYNNIIYNRIEALIDNFPAVTACLSEAFMRQVAQDYCVHYGTKNGNLNIYGDNLGDYLSSLNACKPYNFIKDLADFEFETQSLLYASDENTLSANDFSDAIQVQQSPYLLKASLAFSSEYPIFEISNFCLGKNKDMPVKNKPLYHYFLYRDPETLKIFVRLLLNAEIQIIPILKTSGILGIDDALLENTEIQGFINFLLQKQLWVTYSGLS